jgi:hypothetical protein
MLIAHDCTIYDLFIVIGFSLDRTAEERAYRPKDKIAFSLATSLWLTQRHSSDIKPHFYVDSQYYKIT